MNEKEKSKDRELRVTFSCRIRPSIRHKIEILSSARARSMGKIVEDALSFYFENDKVTKEIVLVNKEVNPITYD